MHLYGELLLDIRDGLEGQRVDQVTHRMFVKPPKDKEKWPMKSKFAAVLRGRPLLEVWA